jgi:hypothetical protein
MRLSVPLNHQYGIIARQDGVLYGLEAVLTSPQKFITLEALRFVDIGKFGRRR